MIFRRLHSFPNVASYSSRKQRLDYLRESTISFKRDNGHDIYNARSAKWCIKIRGISVDTYKDRIATTPPLPLPLPPPFPSSLSHASTDPGTRN